MPSSIGQIINQYLFSIPIDALRIDDKKINRMDWSNFLKRLAVFTCSYSLGTFTATIPGASNATGTIGYRIIGNMAFIVIPVNITGVGSSTAFTVTGIPNVLVTAQGRTVTNIGVEDNTVLTNVANLFTGTGNTWTLGKALNGGAAGWTAAGTKGLIAQTFFFPLD